MKKSSKKTAPPGFAFCNPEEQEEKTSYMSQQGEKIKELFTMGEHYDLKCSQTVVLQELIEKNKNGFFVVDLEQLQELTENLFNQLNSGNESMIQFLKQIISLSVVPFRKIENHDDINCFHHIGGFFASLCPILKLPYEELQLEAAKAICWFAENCGPNLTCENSTFRHFYPITDDNALYSLIPSKLNTGHVIECFCDTFTTYMENVTQNPSTADILTLCFKSLFEFVKRGQAKYIPPTFLTSVLKFVITKYSSKTEDSDAKPICTTRVLAYALLFFDAFIQESPEAMNICTDQLSTIWSFFVENLFEGYKNVQKRIRNELLTIITMIMHTCKPLPEEKNLFAKMFELLQGISQLPLDKTATLSYGGRTRDIRLTHDQVDVELILLVQDLILALHEGQELPEITDTFIIHQVGILHGNLNKYLLDKQEEFTKQALLLLRAFAASKVDVFREEGGTSVIITILESENPPSESILFYVLLLALRLHELFDLCPKAKTSFACALAYLPRENPKIFALTLSLFAVIMQKSEEYVELFWEHFGIEDLKLALGSTSTEVVVAAIDCIRSIAPFKLQNIDQRFVFMLLDGADAAPTLIRYAYVGLFLDLLHYQPFVDAALLWRSLSTNSNIQRTIIRWWRSEEERLDIKYDKCIIIDIDKPLDGHPLVQHSLAPRRPMVEWLLDRDTLPPREQSFHLDFRARLYLMLQAFPELRPEDCKPTDRIKELMVRKYKELKKGSVWSDLKDQLASEGVKPLHEDKEKIEYKLEKMRKRSLEIQEQQCEIWQQCENDRLAMEVRTYNQLADGLKTAQYVAENYKAIVSSQPVAVSRPFQGRTVKGEDVLISTGNLRAQKQEVRRNDEDEAGAALAREKEMEESYINDCLKDESISYLVQLMKNTQTATLETPPATAE